MFACWVDAADVFGTSVAMIASYEPRTGTESCGMAPAEAHVSKTPDSEGALR
jgi:hypothetical protein